MQKEMYRRSSYVLSAPSISLGLLKFRCGVFSLNRRAWVQASALDFLSSGMASLSLNRRAWVQELPNLGCKSTQRGESSHPAVKNPTNRHAPIGQPVEKIAEEVDEIIHTYEYELERQKKNNPRSIDASRSLFRTSLAM